ncbi:PilN domain-containing protein [Lysinibacillus sp. LZ02]|uniref:PilN domain-containing protein n=1 Tax=Lysinibacillus sp. LZ02 TaxID=3420668 RepID=UPI003D3637A9
MIPDINLLPKVDQDEGSSKTIFILIGIITLLLLAVMSWLYFSARVAVVSLAAEEQSLQVERDALQVELTNLQGANQGSLEEAVAFVELVSYDVSPIIDTTKALLPSNTYLRNYTFEQSSVSIDIDFETLNMISAYVERLEQNPYFLDVQVDSIANFDVNPTSEEEAEIDRFTEVPRYSATVMLHINDLYLATGGVD